MSKAFIDRDILITSVKDYLDCSDERCAGCDNEDICIVKTINEQSTFSIKDKLSEVIDFIKNVDYGGEYNCAIDNHLEVLHEYKVDSGYWEVCKVIGDMVQSAGGLDDFLKDYYKSVIKSVCNVLETYKE